jgi:hypothetical protein
VHGADLPQVGDRPPDGRARHPEGLHEVRLARQRLSGRELARLDAREQPPRVLAVRRHLAAVIDLGGLHVGKVPGSLRAEPVRYGSLP